MGSWRTRSSLWGDFLCRTWRSIPPIRRRVQFFVSNLSPFGWICIRLDFYDCRIRSSYRTCCNDLRRLLYVFPLWRCSPNFRKSICCCSVVNSDCGACDQSSKQWQHSSYIHGTQSCSDYHLYCSLLDRCRISSTSNLYSS